MMQLSKLWINLILLAVILLLGACTAPEEQENQAEQAPETPALQKDRVMPPYPITDTIPWKVVEGVEIFLLEEGIGPQPAPGSHVVINYEGRLLDGTIFDSSFDDPGVADFGLNQLIKGWQVGLTAVPTGSKVRLVVPPDMGYGSFARPGIPANSTLIFDIELISTY